MTNNKTEFQLGPDEKVLLQIRRHWINVFPVYLAAGVVVAADLAALYLSGRQHAAWVPLAGFGLTFLAALMAVITVLAYWIYTKNRLILTNRHLIEITWNGIFDKKISQFSLERLQDVSARQAGLVANLLGYGDLTLETAGEEQNFTFHQVPHPESVCSQIMSAHEQALSGRTKDGV